MRLIVPLEEAGTADRSLVGSKAKELGNLIAEGVRVPGGFVVTTDAQALSVDGTVPEAVRAVLREALSSGRFAFRSSAVAEDRGHASYAGQYETVLDVEGIEQAIAALVQCWESARSEAVSRYQSAHGDEDTRIAVLVQRMVDATAAGVTFTANPVTGADEIVIEAVPGVGEALMSGDLTPESWVVGYAPELVSAGPFGTALKAEQAAVVAAECRAIAERRGIPQDIEWAFGDGLLHILQTRPITALPVEPSGRPPDGQSWTRDDSYFPDPVTPLTFTAWLPYHTEAWSQVTEHLGLPFETIDHGQWLGRVYDRLVPIGAPSKDRPLPPRPILKLALRLAPPFRKRLAIAARAAAEDRPLRVIEAWEAGGRDRLRARTTELRRVDRRALTDAELADHLDDVREQTLAAGVAHFMAAMSGTFILAGQLGLVVEEVLGWPPERVVDLIQGYGEASVSDGAELDALAGAIAADPQAAALLADEPERLRDAPGAGGEALRSFLDRNGHRLLSPFMDVPTWAEDPLPLLQLVKTRIDHPAPAADPKEVAHAAEVEARAQITDPEDLARFDRALSRARRGRPYGDETESDTGEVLALVRYIALEAGNRLAARGELGSADNVMYMSVDELGETLRGAAPPEGLSRRRAEYRWALANPTPAAFGPEPGDMPPPDVFPAKTRDIVAAGLWALKMFLTPAQPVRDGDIRGLAASPGRASGPVRIIRSPEEFDRVRPGDIMVCRHTMAAWSPIFPILAGLVTEQGGWLSHPATLAREYALPAVLGVPGATGLFADGQLITVDGGTGLIEA